MNVTTIGIDLAKNSFSVHGVDERGRVVLRKTVSRSKLTPLIAQLPACDIGMEACSGAHEWGRRFELMGHRVGLMAARQVSAYRQGGKNDSNDAAAICEARTRPGMRYVSVKSAEQQAVLCVHRMRQGWIEERTALVNQLRGLLSEFGMVMAVGRDKAQRELRRILDATDDRLPMLVRRMLEEGYQHLVGLNERIGRCDREVTQQARSCPAAQQLMTIPGVAELTATALVASIGDPRQFTNGRQLAAWLGLVPRQYSTGGKIRLGRITKQGDAYLRTLLIHGTRAVLARVKDKRDRVSVWAQELRDRRGYRRATVALAAKNARLVWALLMHGGTYQTRPA